MRSIGPGPLRVSLVFAPDNTLVVGRLALERGRAALEYDPAFIASGLSINPRFPPPDRELLWADEPRTFDGLHGVFADSLPDAWGRELMRRRIVASGTDPSSLNVLDRLAIVGSRGMGALVYEPSVATQQPENIDLDALSRESLDVLAGHGAEEMVSVLEELADSSGGARPKILVAMNATGDLRAGTEAMPRDYNGWIVKFRAPRDRDDAGPLEAAFADMARAAGVEMMPTMLLPSRRSETGYFATRRFDRPDGHERVHVLSAAGLLETDWTIATIDYNALMNATRFVTRSQTDVEQLFRRMVFNIAAHNRDDHAKQYAFLMDGTGTWRLSPAYDINFSAGPGGEHYLSVAGRGSGITGEDVRALAARQSIKPATAAAIIEDVRAAVADFPRFADAYGASDASRKEIAAVTARHVAELAPTASRI